MNKLIILCITCLLTTISCSKKVEDRIEEVPEKVMVLEEISIKKGMCFGRCPAYTLTLDAEGAASYSCDKFCDLDGEYTKQLSLEETGKIFKAAKAMDPLSFQDKYESMVPDMPLTTMHFSFKDTTKVISGKMERPSAIKQVEKMLIMVAQDTSGWKETAASMAKKEKQMIKDNSNHYIIKLKEGISIEKWITSKAEMGVKKVAVYDAQNELWEISFDLEKTTAEDFKYMIERDESISIAKVHTKKRRR